MAEANLEIVAKLRDEASAKMHELKGAALAVGVAFVAAAGTVIEMGNATADAEMKVRMLAMTTGLSAEEASKLTYAAGRLNIDTETLGKSFGIFSKNLELNTHAFKQLHVEVEKNKDGSVDLEGTIAKIADRFKAMPDGVEKTALALQLFGRGGKEMIPLLNEGSDGLKRQAEEATKLGLVFSQSGLDAAFKYKQAQKDLEDQFEAVRNKVGLAVIPVLTALFGFLANAASVILPPLISGLGTVATVLGEMFGVVSGNEPDAGAKLTDLVGHERAAAIMSFIGGVRDGFKKLFAGDIPGFVSDVTSSITGWINNLGGTNAEQIGQAIGAWTVQFVHWLVDSAIPWLQENLPQIVGTLLHFFAVDVPEGIANVVINVGKGIVEGIWSGISGKWDELMGNIMNLVRQLPDPILKFFGIASPSKLMADIGRDLMLGIGLGISTSSEAVLARMMAVMKNVKELASEIVGSVRIELGGAGSAIVTHGMGGGFGLVQASQQVIGHAVGGLGLDIFGPGQAAAGPSIPHFAGGGVKSGDGLAYLHDGETVSKGNHGGGGDIHLHFNAPVYGMADFAQQVRAVVRDGVTSGGFRGVIQRSSS